MSYRGITTPGNLHAHIHIRTNSPTLQNTSTTNSPMQPTKNLEGRVKEIEGRLDSMEDRLHSLKEALDAVHISDLPGTRDVHDSNGTDCKEEAKPSEIPLEGTWDNDFEAQGVFSHYDGGQRSWYGLTRTSTSVGSFNVYTVQGNIAKVNVDVIVNPTNRQLQVGSGVSAAIFKEAGEGLEEVCDDLAPIKEGQAVITDAFKCRASYIAHVAGPVYSCNRELAKKLLYDAYTNAIKKADQLEAFTIAFPSISNGIFGFPEWYSAKVALKAIRDYKPKHLRIVLFCNIDEETCKVYDKLVVL